MSKRRNMLHLACPTPTSSDVVIPTTPFSRGLMDEQTDPFVERQRDSDPAAPYQNLIFIDWDDTLCPTHWIRHALKGHMVETAEWEVGEAQLADDSRTELWQELPSWFLQALPDEPEYTQPMKELISTVESFLKVAAKYGRVVVVTNGIVGWVEKSARKWMPSIKWQLYQQANAVLYAREYAHDKDDPEKFMEMKTSAFRTFLEKGGDRPWKNVISIGDSDFEIEGMYNAARRHHEKTTLKRSTSEPSMRALHKFKQQITLPDEDDAAETVEATMCTTERLFRGTSGYHAKSVKLQIQPSCEWMTRQLKALERHLPALCAAECDCRLSTETEESLAALGSFLGRPEHGVMVGPKLAPPTAQDSPGRLTTTD